MQSRGLVFFVITIVVFYSNFIFANDYPVNEKDRGLILPKSTGEISFGPAWIAGNEQRNMEANFNFRYAFAENLELARLGFRYRFINAKNYQWAFRFQNYGIGTSSEGEFFHHTEFGVDGKQDYRKSVAFLYNFGYFWSDSHENDGNTKEYRAGIGAITKISTKSALYLGYSRRYFSGFGASFANILETKLSYNLGSSLDGFLVFRVSDFNEAVDSVLFNESYNKMMSIGIKWRF